MASAFEFSTQPAHLTFAMFCTLASFSASMPLFGEDSARYLELTGGKRLEIVSREMPSEEGLRLRAETSDGERHDLLLDERLETVRWSFVSPGRGIEATAVREGRTVRLTGKIGKNRIERSWELGDEPWYQSIERSLEPLATGPARSSTLFSVVNPYELSLAVLRAEHRGRERVRTGDRSVGTERELEAVRVRITLPGFASLFWNSSYWFRLPDGKLVRSEAMRGPPGTPLTVVTLIEER